IPSAKTIELPLEDYLDSYAMARAFTEIALKKGSKVSLAAVTMRASRLDDPVRTMDVLTTLRGCEIEKDIPEPVFRAFRTLSQAIGAQRLTFNTAAIHIHGKGYFGKHLFGESIGYPTKNRKSRWTTPGEMMLKDRYSPQTFIEDRDPMMRYALTETLPLEIFIETCNLDYAILKKRSDAVRDVLNRCDYLLVKGNKAKKGAKTDLRVDLIRKTDNHRRMFTSSDCDVRYMIDKDFYKETGKKAGNYANFPSGETFTTPEKVTGTLVGDVVINIDRSRVIPKNRPLIVHFSDKGRWTLNDGPEDIRKKMEKEIAEGLKRIEHLEKQRSLPKSMTDMYRENIDGVGEFAVNTNPKAKLCDYLIVNEKIAGMIHLALGMGFETDKKTVYHWDIVINAPEQEIDIYGFDKKGREQWVMKQGKLVV
ncbi:TPA: hypothetical protein HA270_00550, partial [Candidatus Woesearchaeota archaeon]|nr:hypothetical protein [Candidatus Woesearchaeota archaeon]